MTYNSDLAAMAQIVLGGYVFNEILWCYLPSEYIYYMHIQFIEYHYRKPIAIIYTNISSDREHQLRHAVLPRE